MKRLLPTIVLLLASFTSSGAQEWGTLSGTFIYDGEAPEPSPANVNRDQQVCGTHDLVDEELLVDADSGGIANVVVYLYLKGSESPPEAHPDYAATAEDDVEFDNHNCRFEPHICVLRTTQTLVIGNPDPVAHNTKIEPRNNTGINPQIPSNSSHSCEFPNVESRPVIVSCSAHPWMSAFLFVKDHPYIAVTDEDGQFVIENLPVGDWTFQVWQEKAGYVGGEVQVDGEEQDWGRTGRFDITIEEGDNDLGEVLVPESVFE